jgi:hypothetical protein
MSIEKIDKENVEFFKETIDDVKKGKFTIKDILGFDIAGASVFIPRVPCAHIDPSRTYCKSAQNEGSTSIFSLSPIYDSLIYPIFDGFKEPVNEKNFQEFNGVSVDDFLVFVEKKRIIPYFPNAYQRYDPNLIQKFLEPGMPRISRFHLRLIMDMNCCSLVNTNCEKCGKNLKIATEDLESRLNDKSQITDCSDCLSTLYTTGVNRDALFKSQEPLNTICVLRDILISRNMNAIVKSNCMVANEALGIFSGLTEANQTYDSIVKGLKVSYSPEIDVASYLDFLDGKTTRAVREIIKKITEEPYVAKYSERLSAKLCDLNKEIEEMGRTRPARFYQAVSDIAVYGGSKFLQAESKSLIKVQNKDSHKASEWIASKLFDIHAKVTGKDWTLAQIYKTRVKMEKYKEASKERILNQSLKRGK